MEQTEAKKSRGNASLIVFAILFFLSLGLNAFLYFNYAKKATTLASENEELQALLNSSNLRADSLQAELDQTIAALQQKIDDSYLMESELRSELEEKKVELERQRARISTLIAQGNTGGGGGTLSLAKARAEIDELKKSNAAYSKELDELKKVYAIAQDAADRFSGKVSYYQGANDSLQTANDTLEKRIRDLAVLQISDLEVIGLRTKKDEKETTFKAKKVENLEINFTVLPSDAIQTGEHTIAVRIIGTSGEVLLENLDQLTDSDDLISFEYTIDYSGDEQEVSIEYSQEAEFKVGNHKIEIYQDGKLIDRLGFQLL